MEFHATHTRNGLGIWTISIKGNDWQKFLKNAETTTLKNVAVQGFRKGKVPEVIARQHIDQKTIINEANRMAIKKGYRFALEQKTDIQPISKINPLVKQSNESKCVIQFQFDIKPQLKIKKYKGFDDIVKLKPKVKKEMVDDEIKKIMDRFAVLEVKANGIVEDGDNVLIDFVGKIDGKEFAGGKASDYALDIGSNQFIPGFEKSMLGWKVKTKKNIKLNFPMDYHVVEIRGKKVTFEVNLKEIKRKIMPKLDDKFVQDDLKIKDVNDVVGLEKYIKEKVLQNLTKNEVNRFINILLERIVEDSNIIVPNSMIVNQRKQLYKEFEQKVLSQQITIKEYMNRTKLTMDDINDELEKDAKRMLQNSFILDEIIKKEKIQVDKNEIENEYKKLAQRFGIKSDDKAIKNYIPEEQIVSSIKKDKVLRFLFDNNGKVK